MLGNSYGRLRTNWRIRSAAAQYRAARYTNPLGQTFYGTPAIYSLSIPTATQDPAGAAAFAAFALSDAGHTIFRQHGFLEADALFGGDLAAVPSMLRPLIQGAYMGATAE